MKLIFCGLVGLGLFLLSGCSGDERLAEKARIEGREQATAELQAQIDHISQVEQRARAEGRATADADITAQNGNLAHRSQEMEADLAERHRFYQALRGDYEGTLATEQGRYRVRISFVPSLPPLRVFRTRQIEEISSDLNNLYLNAQIVQWNPINRLSAVGCRVEGIRPDIVNGEIAIASESCPNLYTLKIAGSGPVPLNNAAPATPTEAHGEAFIASSETASLSASLATSIRAGRLSRVSEIQGEVHPTTNAAIYQLTVSRVSR